MPTPLRVAIIGGSISGCTLANGLLRHDHLEFDIFESKSSFQERGAAIALHTNALAALRHLGLDVDELLREARANKRDRLQTIVVRVDLNLDVSPDALC
jgi:salicylate hydroxylase